MKVALVTNSFPTLSETFIYNHAAGLRAAGVDVTVIAARPSTDAAMFADYDGVRYDGPIRFAILSGKIADTAQRFVAHLARSSARELAMWGEARARYGTSKRALRAWLLAIPCAGFDIVHFEYSGLAVAWIDALPLLAPARVIVSCRGGAERITPLVDPSRAKQLGAVFALSDRVHCVSEVMRDTCATYGLDPAKAFVNHPAIDANRFRRAGPYVVRAAGPFRLLSTGRLHWTKGLEFALMAVRSVLDAGHDVHYEIVGSGPDEAHLRYAAQDLRLMAHVTFAGQRSSTEVRAALEQCDIYLLSSLSEGISNAALEAMAMAIPVVTTTAGGMAEAVRDGEDGLLVEPRSAAAMASQIAVLLQNGNRRLELGGAARRRVEQDFSIERQIRCFLREYESLV